MIGIDSVTLNKEVARGSCCYTERKIVSIIEKNVFWTFFIRIY
jgi:hypothetical protein